MYDDRVPKLTSVGLVETTPSNETGGGERGPCIITAESVTNTMRAPNIYGYERKDDAPIDSNRRRVVSCDI